MSSIIKIAVDAMGGDNSPKKVIDGIIHHYSSNKNVFYKIFGDESQIIKIRQQSTLRRAVTQLSRAVQQLEQDIQN